MNEQTKVQNERLLKLQANYLESKSDKDYVALWRAIERQADRIIQHERISKGFYLSRDDVTEYKNIVAYRIMRRYKKVPVNPKIHQERGFYKIESNYISAIWWQCKWVLWNQKTKEKDKHERQFTESERNIGYI